MKNGVLLTATLLGSLLISAQAVAGASANIGATSNYIWRGLTQSQDRGAFSGGLDYEAENGLYVGTWASGLGGHGLGEEVDVYAGYAKELPNGFAYDVAATTYQYPTATAGNAHFEEVSLKGSYGIAEAGVAYTVSSKDDTTAEFSKGDKYYHIGVNKELANGFSVGGTVGKYDFDDAAGDDYTHTQIALTKSFKKAGDFVLAADKPSGRVGVTDTKVSLSWTKSFDF
ncbi:TorF family putative porin [Thiothrix unzii]|uniref:TorF family putative porin n=1 Tax=Thiothrix unzii TaxID=111769 RepID=A0A975FBD3_9GAMM|nr:TorF family putative porin [Thiothrix unzii]QTR53865.1 TorF family putative porin [Thiothrix unzii]